MPEFSGEPDKKQLRQFCQREFGASLGELEQLETFRHTFSHYHLDIHPVVLTIDKLPAKVMEAERKIWYNPRKPEKIGLPKPVQFLLSKWE